MVSIREDFVDEVARLGASIDQVIADIRYSSLQRDSPFRDLDALFNLQPSFTAQVRDFAEEMWDTAALAQSAMDFSEIDTLRQLLTALETELFNIRSAISWSTTSSGFYWWLKQRQSELNIRDVIIIPKPSHATLFRIDPRGELMHKLTNLSTILELSADQIKLLGNVRLLNVPKHDGMDPRWHPLTLAHEIAHLKYNFQWIVEWIRSQLASSFRRQETKLALSFAKALGSKKKPIASAQGTGSAWFEYLAKWLGEVACDSVLSFFYRDEGVVALEQYMAIASRPTSSETHPSPGMRCAVQRVSSVRELAQYCERSKQRMDWWQTERSFCELALRLRWDLHRELEGIMGGTDFQREAECMLLSSVEAITESTAGEAHSPPSQTWDRRIVLERPSAIESGLIRALWTRTKHFEVVGDGDGSSSAGEFQERFTFAAMDARGGHIHRAIESLQFCHRFEVERANDRTADRRRLHEPIANVIWLTRQGASLQRGASSAESEAAIDLRLGRHFIAFVRNRIATLSALDVRNSMSRTQEYVEIDWGDVFVLHPGEMVLGVTMESFVLDEDVTAQVLSRSSIGRLGLLSATAVHVQPGFRGCLTLELVNLASIPLQLVPGQRIAQIVPSPALGRPGGYSGKYQDQSWRPQYSSASQDWDARILSSIRRVDDQLVRD